jgi:hypothetical protein
MLETIRTYALEQLTACGVVDNARLHHVIFFLREAEAAEQQLYRDRQDMCVERIAADCDNVRAALMLLQVY